MFKLEVEVEYMLNNKKGISLTVLVIAIAVIIIISSTAVITIRSITKDREISEFMTDLTDVKQYVIEYFGREGILPTKPELDGETDAEQTLINTLGEESLNQIDDADTGDYYFVDLTKLGKIHLSDTDRGYIINEGTLNVYVINPTTYENTKYYTITPYLSGRENAINVNVPFEVNIMGNPVTWVDKANILVYVTNMKIGEADGWNFRWLKGSHSLDDFKSEPTINYFTYGDTITFEENGIYTINVENPEGKGIVRKVVVTKVDDIAPTIKKVNGKLVIDDAETGVKAIRYKIKETRDFQFSDAARSENPRYYTSQAEEADDTAETAVNKYLGTKEIKGDKIEDYIADYDVYYGKYTSYYNIISNAESTSGDVLNAQRQLRALNNSYPQFTYQNRVFPNTEKNIVIYVEDMAGNGAVYSAISRNEIVLLEYVSIGEETMNDSKVVINNGDAYTKSRKVSLYLQAMYANYFYASEEENPSGTFDYFYSNRENFTLSSGDGEKTVYVQFSDENKKIVKVSDTIILDQTPPSTTAPSVSWDGSNITITVNQTDSKIVNSEETQSGLTGTYQYGIRKEGVGEYQWYNSIDDIPKLEEGETYEVVTKATDRAGNSQTSDARAFTAS